MIVCDLCNSTAKMHICPKCYSVAKHLLEMYEEKFNEKKLKKKRGRPKKIDKGVTTKNRGRPKKQVLLKKEVKKEISREEADAALSKCWTCEYGFLSQGGDVSCTEGKESITCEMAKKSISD